MNHTTRQFTMVLALAIAFAVAATPALAASPLAYKFFQDGYSDGATVTGTFTGTDLDNNGILVHFPGRGGGQPIDFEELSAFSMHFSGNSLSPAFDLSLGDLFGFVYEIGSSGLGDDPAFDPTLNQNLTEGVGVIGANHFYTSGLGPNGMLGGFVGAQFDFTDPSGIAGSALDTTDNLVQVASVPEPTSATLLVAALGSLLAIGARSPAR